MDISKIRPTNGNLVVEVYEGAKETRSGLILAGDQSNNTPVIGTVIAAPAGSPYLGKTVIFRRYAIDELKFTDTDGEKIVYILHDSEILGEIIRSNTNDHASRTSQEIARQKGRPGKEDRQESRAKKAQ